MHFLLLRIVKDFNFDALACPSWRSLAQIWTNTSTVSPSLQLRACGTRCGLGSGGAALCQNQVVHVLTRPSRMSIPERAIAQNHGSAEQSFTKRRNWTHVNSAHLYLLEISRPLSRYRGTSEATSGVWYQDPDGRGFNEVDGRPTPRGLYLLRLASIPPSGSDGGSRVETSPHAKIRKRREDGGGWRRRGGGGSVCSWKTLRVPVILAGKEIDKEEKEETWK